MKRDPVLPLYAPLLAVLIVLPALGVPVFGAEITVPKLEFATRGAVKDDTFVLSSAASADIAIEGGGKYGVYLGFSFAAPNLEKAFAYGNVRITPVTAAPTADDYNALADRLNNQAVVALRVAKAAAREPFGAPLEVAYFLGEADSFCSGDDFPLFFGTPPMGTDFKGFMYFPEGIGGDITRQYDGIHKVRGTGLSAAVTYWEKIVPMAYFYQDIGTIDSATGLPDLGKYSGDLRVLVNAGPAKLEAFGGISFRPGEDTIYRGGFLAHLTAGEGAAFLIQCGIPGWEQGDTFSVDNLYFLIEPRLRFGMFAVYTTFFYHPLWYLQEKTPDEQGKADINLKFLYGDMVSRMFEFGLELTGGLHSGGIDSSYFMVSPFLSAATGGLRWDLKIRVKPLDYDTPKEMFDTFIGIRTAY
ncbi:hypothetical protein [Breznakiella homolactica]|uniref:Uncharacterized protein n=1 Tax=Breznakiella homolactica TaxID=2798577 RepID=A0A7T8BAK9_9SPIR|nr:hypothetical protein [Breznakiella homolactica]QQO10804.1 hypothetical protein JFL75_07765 [Breznakiella homolactica]